MMVFEGGRWKRLEGGGRWKKGHPGSVLSQFCHSSASVFVVMEKMILSTPPTANKRQDVAISSKRSLVSGRYGLQTDQPSQEGETAAKDSLLLLSSCNVTGTALLHHFTTFYCPTLLGLIPHCAYSFPGFSVF